MNVLHDGHIKAVCQNHCCKIGGSYNVDAFSFNSKFSGTLIFILELKLYLRSKLAARVMQGKMKFSDKSKKKLFGKEIIITCYKSEATQAFCQRCGQKPF